MDVHAAEYFSEKSEDSPNGQFHEVIPLHLPEPLTWEQVVELCPSFPRGWYELSQLSTPDRIEFTREHWLVSLPYQPHTHEQLAQFFSRLDEIGVYLVQATPGSPYAAQLCYSLEDNGGFFHGNAPVNDAEIEFAQQAFNPLLLPKDYIAFLKIHDGFSKYSDTGLSPLENLHHDYRSFQKFLDSKDPVCLPSGEAINPQHLIPFYESFGMHCYQCFFTEWYPEQEMGIVYYSGIDHALTDFEKNPGPENLSFSTFVDWLTFYTEPIE